jgi:acetolactate synthase-1/2/3 large subunit
MKFSAAAAAIFVASALHPTNALAFTPAALTRSRRAPVSNKGVEHHPTRGNVSYRKKVRAWHRLSLEPWCGVKMSSAVDENPTFKIAADLLAENDAADFAEERSPYGQQQQEPSNEQEEVERNKKSVLRSEAETYLRTFQGESGAAIIFSKLVEHGVHTVNGYSGGAVLPLLDQFSMDHPRHGGEVSKIRWITNSNENSSGHVAEGMAKSSTESDGRLAAGVVVATSGPGVTNLITPLQDAIADGVPLVVLCGQAATNAPPDAFQGAPAVELTSPCTKWSYQIKSAVELPFVMDYAFYVARNGRPGPVFIDLPKDLQTQVLTDELITNYMREEIRNRSATDIDPLVRLQHMPRADGTSDEALMVGNDRKGRLPFLVGNGKIEPIPISPEMKFSAVDLYRWDHTPSNKIFTKLVEDKEGGASFTSPTMKTLMDTIQNAKKPFIIAGQGCNDCSEELKKFAEKLQIPVASTLHGLGSFDERHPLALNMVGMHGHPTPNFMAQECDMMICIGSRFDDRITGRLNSFIPEAKLAEAEGRGGVIHVDIRLSEKSKSVNPTFFIHSFAKTFLTEANKYMEQQELTNPTDFPNREIVRPWFNHMKALQREYPIGIPGFYPEKIVDEKTGESVVRTRMSSQYVVRAMNDQLLKADVIDDCLFTTGVGIHQMVAAQLITWTKPRQMLSSGSLGTMGVALGYVIGAKLANGNKMCISIDGDGSFNMTFTELKTVAEYNIPVKIMILDNECQMMVEYWQRLFFDGRYIAVHNQQNPEYTKLAEAFGIKAIYCDCEEDLEAKMNEFLFSDPNEPVLFHVRVERTPCLPLVAPGQALNDMILVDDQYQEVDKSVAPS